MNEQFAKRLLAMALAAGLTLSGLPAYATETNPSTETAQTVETTQATEASQATESTQAAQTTQPAEATQPEETTQPTETTPATQPDPDILTVSQACLDMIKGYEGFSVKPYWDYSQYTVGYGTRCPDDMRAYYTEHGITEEEAELLLRNHIAGVEQHIHKRIIDKYGLELTQYQFDALISFSYNVGTSWMSDSGSAFLQMVISGSTDENYVVDRFTRWSHAGGELVTGLIRRRLSEANVYLHGEYAQIPPTNYCYIRYDANGGSVSSDVQGFVSDLGADIAVTATRTGYTFDGWFTTRTGGTKVEKLDASVGNLTLFARWTSTGDSGVEQPTETVDVTVTGSKVNLRQGPGTNYSIVGQANTGDKLTIDLVAVGTDYIWGQSEKGWICLDYTNFEDVIAEDPSGEDPAEPTEPEATQPQPTEPQPTEPEATQPTEPEATQPQEPAKVMGTVKVNDTLRVRSGTGTGYSVVAYLKSGDRVEILEQKTVGASVWGRIDKGWVCMDYVVLDSTDATPPETTTPPASTAVTGTVKVSDTLRIRSGTGTSYAVAGYLKNGDKVEILEQKSVGGEQWGRIEKGWISMAYVKLDAQQTPETTTPPETSTPDTATPPASTAVTGTITVSDVLRIRSGAGTGNSVSGYLKNGEKVTILETTTVDGAQWGRIEKGWISMAYVQLDQTTSGQTVSKTITASCLRVRQTAGTGSQVVGYYYSGAKVEILETTTAGGEQWGRTSKGWISLTYTK